MDTTHVNTQLMEVAFRIREMRAICGFTETEMARKTDTTPEEYRAYEGGIADLPFTFIHKCSLAFGIGITDLLEGHSAHLSSYTVTRKGQGQQSASYHPSGQPPGRVNLFALVDAPGAVGAEGGCIRQLGSAVGTGFLLAHDSASIRYMTSLYRLAGLTWVHRWITRPSRPSASLLEGCWPVSSTFISTPRE